MNKKSLLFGVLAITLVLIFALSGCIPHNQSQSPSDQGESQGQEQHPLKEEPKGEQEQKEEPKIQENPAENKNQGVYPEPQAQEKEVTLYFMNKKIVETGQGEYSDMIKETRKVKFGQQPLEEVIIEQLKAGPTDDEGITLLKKDLQVIGVEVADKTAYVNLSSQGLSGSSLQETGLIYQIVHSLTELDNVERVQFLVDGIKKETLFGHYDTQVPWTKSMIQ